MNDDVEHPSHYCRGEIEPLDFIASNRLLQPEGSVIKYLYRWRFKHSTPNGQLQDLNKAHKYLRVAMAQRQSDSFSPHSRPAEGIDPERFIAATPHWGEREATIVRAIYYSCESGGMAQLCQAQQQLSMLIRDESNR